MSPSAQVVDLASARDKFPPEALLISALIDSGSFRPDKYGVFDHHISAHRDVWDKCKEYQEKAGKAPGLDLVRMWSKTFPYMQDVSGEWASDELVSAWMQRESRRLMMQATQALADGEFALAQDYLKQAGGLTGRSLRSYLTPLDFDTVWEDTSGEHIPVSDPTSRIHEITSGGIQPGALWVYAARPGIGKTWALIQSAVHAAEAGWNVIFHSAEMPAPQIMRRLWNYQIRGYLQTNRVPFHDLSRGQIRLEVEKWQAEAGTIKVVEPKDVMGKGRQLNAAGIASAHEDSTLAVVDYVTKLATNAGKAFREDWSVASTLVGELSETCRDDRIPLLTASQINRSASENAGTEALSYSDALGQEATFVMTMKKESRRVSMKRVVKYRHGQGDDIWYTRFSPGSGDFSDLSIDQAMELKEQDETARAT